MDRDASSDETALQTSSSDIEDTRQVENDNQDADLTRLSQIDLGNENRRMLKQPLLPPSTDTSINISTPSATGSEISKENSNTMDDSDVYKYPIGDYQKGNSLNMLPEPISTVMATCLNGPRKLTPWTLSGVDFLYSSTLYCAVLVRYYYIWFIPVWRLMAANVLLRQIGFVNSPVFGLGTFLVALFTEYVLP